MYKTWLLLSCFEESSSQEQKRKKIKHVRKTHNESISVVSQQYHPVENLNGLVFTQTEKSFLVDCRDLAHFCNPLIG